MLFESGSGKWLRLGTPVQFHSDRINATPISPDQLEQVIAQYRLEYVRHTLQLQPLPVEPTSVRDHVRAVLGKLSG